MKTVTRPPDEKDGSARQRSIVEKPPLREFIIETLSRAITEWHEPPVVLREEFIEWREELL